MQNPAMLATPTAPALSLAMEKLKASPQPARLAAVSEDEIETLLQHLVKARWQRLSSLFEDPLAVLFDAQSHQWTAGWDPDTQDLYLLLWEQPAWQAKPMWTLLRNGESILQEADGASKNRSMLLHKLLDSEQLPYLTQEQFLAPLISYRNSPEDRDLMTSKLLATILARPQFFEPLREALFKALEQGLADPDWPLLDVLKIHRVACKNNMVRLFQNLVKAGFIQALRENVRLDAALSLLQEDYAYLGYKISLFFRPSYDASFEEFRKLMTDGTWRARLRLKPPGGAINTTPPQPKPPQAAWSFV
jgi:hypothetical protein